MIRSEPRMESVEYIEECTCDKCGKDIELTFDLQEALMINFVGGYTSVFGDGSQVNAEICQDCLKEFIGSFCRVS